MPNRDAKSLSNDLTDGLNGQPEIRPDSVNDAVLTWDCARRDRRQSGAEQPNVHRTTSAPPPRGPNAECSVNASYNDCYHDYDVHLQSNQPDASVTVTDAAGHTDTWHTDSSGYADVYFHARADAAGEEITARVDAASCRGAL